MDGLLCGCSNTHARNTSSDWTNDSHFAFLRTHDDGFSELYWTWTSTFAFDFFATEDWNISYILTYRYPTYLRFTAYYFTHLRSLSLYFPLICMQL